MRWGILAASLVLAMCVAAATRASAQTPPFVVNGDFEAGVTGWAPADGGTLTAGAADPVNGGAAAGHVVSSSSAPVSIRTQYWLGAAATPGNEYALSLALRIPAGTMTSVTARIDVVTLAGAIISSNQAITPGPTTGYVTLTTTPLTALAGTEFVQVVVTGTPTGAGAKFSVDDIVVTEVVPPPLPAPPPEPVIPADPDPGPAPAVATPIRTTVSTARRPTATPSPEPRGSALVNTRFDTGLAGWNVVQGRAWTDTWVPGEGQSLVLHTDSASTVWVEQALNGIQPGAWYGASALLSTTGEVELGWLRLAWHDSPDGRGRELAYADSRAVGNLEGRELSAAPRYQVVGTNAVQAPPLAASATVRFMLRSSARAGLVIDNVAFGETADPAGATRPGEVLRPAPPAPAPPAPGASATPAVIEGAFAGLGRPAATPVRARAVTTPPATSTARPALSPVPRIGPTPAPPIGGLPRIEDVATNGVEDTQRALRMTQVLPDPAPAGRDTDYEWVEITNLGSAPASVEGMTLRDNAGAVTLPAIVLPPGGSLVVSARLAEVAGATAFRAPQGIGNGLGNTGDRLVLAAADGRQVDAFSYGEDATFLAGPRIPAPGTGRALLREFGPDGRFRAARVIESPVPGRAPVEASPATGAPASADGSSSATTGAAGTWVVLLSLGAGLLGGAAMQRLSAVAARERR